MVKFWFKGKSLLRIKTAKALTGLKRETSYTFCLSDYFCKLQLLKKKKEKRKALVVTYQVKVFFQFWKITGNSGPV